MSKALIEKLRRAREFIVEVDGHKFTVRRPTDAEVVTMPDASAVEYVRRFVVGWDLRGIDIQADGAPEPEPFDRDIWIEWADDHAEVWDKLATSMLDAYKRHAEARGSAEKN